MRNTIISSIRQGIRNAIESVVSALAPIFYWPGTHTLEATTGTDPTFTRATAATFEDFEGLIKTVESSEPRFQGARRVENLVPNSSNSEWMNTFSNATVVGSEVTFSGNGYALKNFSSLTTGSTDFVISVTIQKGTKSGSVYLGQQTYSNTSEYFPTSTPTRISHVVSGTGNPAGYFGLLNADGTTGTVIATDWQFEVIDGQTNQNPSEYVSTGVGTGPELVTNGDFATDSDWTLTNGTITGGQFVGGASGAQGAQQTSTDVVEGKAYRVTFDAYISSSVSTVYLRLGAGSNIGSWTVGVTPTTFTGTFTAAGAGGLIYLLAGSANSLHLDNISVKAVDHGANVDGVEYFNTLNANTVTANVVTEAVGSPLTRANTQFGELHGGVVGVAPANYFSTPNVVTTWPELDIRVRVQIDSFPNGYALLFDKRNSFYLSATPSGSTQRVYLVVYDATGGSSVFNSSDFPTSVLGVRNWYRVTYDATTGDAKFFTADGNLESPAVSDYVQLSTLTYAPRAISVNTNSFLAGTWGSGLTTYPFDGDIYRSQVFNEIDGTTPVVDFTAGSYVSGSTLVSSTSGETWTLEGNASIFQPPVDASGPFGYLAEKASTNLALQSEDFTTSWTAQGATVTANAAVAPDGTTTMDRLVVDTANNFHDVYQLKTVVASTNYTHSVYMKDDGAGFGGINFGVGNDYISVVADLSTGLVTDTDVGSTSGTIVATGCEDAGNGVYRVWISGSIGATAGYMIPFLSDVAVPSAWSGGRPQYTGVLGEDILVWGAQLEAGTYPTSYIPTTTTDVLRNADVLIAGDMVTDAAGSAYAEASSIWTTLVSGAAYLLDRGDAYKGRILYRNTGAANQIFVWDGANQSSEISDPSYYNRPAPMASTWGNNLTVYKDNVAGNIGAYDGTMGAGNLGIGSTQAGGSQWDGTIREVKIFDSELTAAEVGDL